jgi:hypothetical protein
MKKQLEVSSVSTTGKYHNERAKYGTVYVNVNEGYQTDNYQIAVSVIAGSGSTAKPRENELVNISFPDQPFWSGTFEDLRKALAAVKVARMPAKSIVKYMELYKEHLGENGVDDDSNAITVADLIQFVEEQSGLVFL